MVGHQSPAKNRAGTDTRNGTPAAHPEGNRSGPDFLRALFRLLDECEIRYCVLHSWEGLPRDLPSDLDLAIHPQDAEKLPFLIQALRKLGYLPILALHHAEGQRYDFAWSNRSEMICVAVDIIYEYREAGLILMRGESLVAGRQRCGDFWVAYPAIEFPYLLAKKAAKGTVPPRQEQRLKSLVEKLGPLRAEEIAGHLFGEECGVEIVQACTAGRLGSFLGKAGRRLWWTTVARNPLNPARYLLRDVLRLIRRWFRRTGIFVVILGPDGVGKSTVAGGLSEAFARVFTRYRIFHWRPMVIPSRQRTSGPVTEPHGKPPRGSLGSIAFLSVFFLDCWLGYWLVIRPLLARTGLVVFDRYFHDLLVDPKRYRYGGPLWAVRALRPFLPKPDLVLILDAPEEVILSRKQEVGRQEVQRQRQNYLGQASEFSYTRVIDAAHALPQVVAEAAGAVNEYLTQRFQRRHARWLALGQQAAQSQSSRRVPGLLP